MNTKRWLLVWMMILCFALSFNISVADKLENVLQIVVGEKTHGLMETSRVKAAVVDNLEGQRCIRIAHNTSNGSWILQSSPWMALPIWLNDYHDDHKRLREAMLAVAAFSMI